jgi:hypothetical protein
MTGPTPAKRKRKSSSGKGRSSKMIVWYTLFKYNNLVQILIVDKFVLNTNCFTMLDGLKMRLGNMLRANVKNPYV